MPEGLRRAVGRLVSSHSARFGTIRSFSQTLLPIETTETIESRTPMTWTAWEERNMTGNSLCMCEACKEEYDLETLSRFIDTTRVDEYCRVSAKEFNRKFRAKAAELAFSRENKVQLISIRNRIKRRSLKEAIVSHLGGKCESCESCGYCEIASVLDFHHVNRSEKESVVSDLLSRAASKKGLIRLIKEAEKCILLCPTCHATEHHFEKSLSRIQHGPVNTVVPASLNRPF